MAPPVAKIYIRYCRYIPLPRKHFLSRPYNRLPSHNYKLWMAQPHDPQLWPPTNPCTTGRFIQNELCRTSPLHLHQPQEGGLKLVHSQNRRIFRYPSVTSLLQHGWVPISQNSELLRKTHPPRPRPSMTPSPVTHPYVSVCVWSMCRKYVSEAPQGVSAW